jgi:hypothetical protein
MRLPRWVHTFHAESACALRERFAPVTDESELSTVADEPSQEDFDAADEEEPQVGARDVLVRVLKIVGVLLVIVALLLYFVVPVSSVSFHWRRLGPVMRTIPLAPERRSSPKVSVSEATGAAWSRVGSSSRIS